MATVAAESLQSQLLAAGHNAADTDIQIVVGREGILAARREICNAAKKEICAFDKPPYVQPRPNATTDDLDKMSPEWQALERGVKVRGRLPSRASTPTGWPSSRCSPRRASSPGPRRYR